MMNERFTYKGFVGAPRIDVEENVIRGKVVNTRDTITFYGKTVDEAAQAFRDSVDDYLEYCADLGVAPEKPFSGKYLVRTTPELHRDLAMISQGTGLSVAQITRRALRREVDRLKAKLSSGGTKSSSAKGVRSTKPKAAKRTGSR
jgi:predicted HicB family RNase H-like nuclease